MKADFVFIQVTISVFIFYLGLGESKVLHILPSPNVPCLEDPCLTLTQLATNMSCLDDISTELVFSEGNHTINSKFAVSNVGELVLILNSSSNSSSQANIICYQNASFKFANMQSLHVKGLVFIGCGNNMVMSVNRLIVEMSSFVGQNGTGTALQIIKTNATIVSSYFSANTLGSRCLVLFEYHISSPFIGGAIVAYLSNVTITKSSFTSNKANLGGAIFAYYSDISITSSSFIDNQVTPYTHTYKYSHCSRSSRMLLWIDQEAMKNRLDVKKISDEGMFYLASVIATFNTTTFVHDSLFHNNTGVCGGAMSIFQNSSAIIYNSEFSRNSATQFGGVLVVGFASVIIHNCSFNNSYAKQGGVIKVGHSAVNISHSRFRGNEAYYTGGVLRLDQSSQLHVYNCVFIENQAYAGGVVADKTATSLTFVDNVFSNNTAIGTGGVIFTVQSQIYFQGVCYLSDNYARTGGAMHLTKSEVNVYKELTVTSNVANHTGGGIYIHHSNLNCHHGSTLTISGNNANINGGGIIAINSLITMFCDSNFDEQASLRFHENMAPKGGGICLESYSQIYIFKTHSDVSNVNLKFTSNQAVYGEAIYVSDDTYFEVCSSHAAECFIQIVTPQSRTDYNLISNLTTVEFTQSNSTNSLLFGGLLDRCFIDRFAEIVIEQKRQVLSRSSEHIDGVTFLKMVSNLNNTDTIISTPIRICFCTPSNQTNCSYTPPDFYVKKGEKFNVSLVAVDQVNHTMMNVTIHGYLKYAESSLDPGQTTQETKVGCTNLTFSIASPHSPEQLILYAEGPCRNASHSQKRVNVSFLPCECPRGFQATSTESIKCECSCDPKLELYVSGCNSTTTLLARDSSAWISYYDSGSNSNSSGYLIYPYCPLDYCLPKYPNVQINLNTVNGADAQCANNRSGILCGLCKSGLSLSCGSSRCLPRPKHWYLNFIGMCILLIFTGVFLVASLMFLNITVAVGTINGLIFYSNIIDANSNTFPSTKYISIMTSLLNVKIEIDTCFFEGMDTFWKTWFQLAFPTYLIILVIIVIILSNHSMRFSQLIAKKNPVATLATLILLSYTTFLRNTISILSFADLHYPDGSHRRVWLPDASIDYLRGRHIALFLVAIFILVLGIAYTCILFSWQWLLRYQDKAFLLWVRSNKLRHFLEPYHAPYKFKYRYWTGLLLFVRVALYLVFALNVSGDPRINLLAIILMVGGILFYKGHLGRIYWTNTVDTIEMVCYFNICSYSAIQLFLQHAEISHKQTVNYAAYISGAVTSILLLSVVVYHGYSVLCTWCLQSKWSNLDKECNHAIMNTPVVKDLSSDIERQPNCDSINSPRIMDDVVSLASTDSATPLLDD